MTTDFDPNSVRRQAAGAMQAADFSTAAALWQRYRTNCPEEVIGWTSEATALWQGGNGMAARAVIEAALERFPRDEKVMGAAVMVATAIGDWKMAEVQARHLLDADPNSIWACRQLATAFGAQGLWEEAEACLDQAAARTPDDMALAVAHAGIATRRQAWAEAEARWATVNQRFGSPPEAVLGLAEVRLAQHRFEEASTLLKNLPPDVSASRRVNRLMARLASASQDWEQAEQLWRVEAEHGPTDITAQFERAVALASLGSHEAAQNALTGAAKRANTDPDRRRSLLRNVSRHARNLLEKGDLAVAYALFEWITNQQPEQLDSWMYIVHLRRLWQQDAAADIALATAMEKLQDRMNTARTPMSDPCLSDSSSSPALLAENERIRLEAYTRRPLGWPAHPRTEQILNALIVPQNKWVPRGRWPAPHPFQSFFGDTPPMLNGGAYDADGRIVRRAIHYSAERAYVPDSIPETSSPPKYLRGRWLYAGPVHRHFGQLMVESTGRFWALAEVGNSVDGIVCICGDIEADDEREKFDDAFVAEWVAYVSHMTNHTQAIQALSAGKPIHFVTTPVRVDELIVPDQLSGFARRAPQILVGHESHRSYLRGCIDRLCANIPFSSDRIYVSRSMMPVTLGFFFREDLLEQNLRHEGYKIIHPQNMSFVEQMNAYRRASHVVLGTGSACHVLAMAADGRQHVALLGREQSSDPNFAAQLRAMGAPVTEIEAWEGSFQPLPHSDPHKPQRVPSHRAIAALDLGAVWLRLQKEGFVDKPIADDGAASDGAAMDGLLRQLEQARGVPFGLRKS